MRTILKLCLTITFLLCAYSYVDAQTLCTESRCYKLQDELGFYIDTGNPLPTTIGSQTAMLTPCNENRCVKLVDKDGNYITINNPLPTTGGGGGGGTTIPAFTGIVVQTSSGVFAGRTVVAGSAKLTCTNNDGVAGNMTCDLGSVASTDLTDTVKIVLTDTTQSITGTKTFAAGALKGTDAWLTNGLKDNNGNFVIHTTATASAVDYLDCTNAATGNPATITCTATGTDSNINIAFVPKGTGSLISGTGSATGALNGGSLVLNGATSGSVTQTVASAVGGAFTITWPGGTTNFTSTGGTSQVVKQTSSGGAFTVAQLACSDLSNAAASCSTDATSATNITSGTLPAARMIAANMPVPSLTTGTTQTLLAPRGYAICTGTCTITVPVPAAGYEFCILNDDNVATVITLAALGSSARYENQARTAYGTAGTGTLVSAGAVKDQVCLIGRDSTHYLTVNASGTWTAN